MAFTSKPYETLISLTKEAIDAAAVPLRARIAKSRADGKMADIEERMLTLESKIGEQCASKEIDFDKIISAIDEYDLLERRHKQISKLIKELFPDK